MNRSARLLLFSDVPEEWDWREDDAVERLAKGPDLLKLTDGYVRHIASAQFLKLHSESFLLRGFGRSCELVANGLQLGAA